MEYMPPATMQSGKVRRGRALYSFGTETWTKRGFIGGESGGCLLKLEEGEGKGGR